jgi:hypothetical protein
LEFESIGKGHKKYCVKYITGYIEKTFFSVEVANDPDKILLRCKITGGIYHPGSDEFNKLSEFYGDIAYNNYKYSVESDFEDICTSGSINNINIVCDKNINAAHPSGTSLNNIFTYKAFSYTYFIKNNYIDLSEGQIEDKPLSTLSQDDCSLLKDGMFFLTCRIDSQIRPGDYLFTVTFENEKGEIFEAKNTLIIR